LEIGCDQQTENTILPDPNNMASPGLNEESVEKRLMSVTNTQDSIQGLSLWIIHHKTHHVRIVELWYKVMKKSGKHSFYLPHFYYYYYF